MRLCGGDGDDLLRNAERCVTYDHDDRDDETDEVDVGLDDGDVDVKGGNADELGTRERGTYDGL
jgi:hypothetical protein